LRIERLYLKAFGPFTEREIDFGAQGGRLHLVYGPNEAGKSSLLRAVHALLYGFPARTDDNFRHGYSALRVGGVLVDQAGKRHAVIRKKANVRSLLEWNGKAGPDCEGNVLPDRLIGELMGGIDEEQFSRMFGIGRDVLIQGGKAIAEGQGNVGESLFEAGAGLLGLRKLREEIEAESDKLFKLRASTPLINAAVAEYEELRRQTKEATVRTEVWAQLEENCRLADAALKANRETLVTRRGEGERLERIRKNLPLIARREEGLKELADLATAPDLAEDFPARRAAAIAGRDGTERRRVEAAKRVAELEARVAAIEVPEAYVERTNLIEGLHQQIGVVQQSQIAIPGLEAHAKAGEAEATKKLKEIEFEGDLAAAESLRPKRGAQAKLNGLAQEHASLSAKVAELRRDKSDKGADLKAAEDALSATPEPGDPAPLEEAVRAGSAHAETERRIATLDREIAQRNKELERACAALGTRSAAVLRDLATPAKATLERLRVERDAIDGKRRDIESALASTRKDLAAQQKKLKMLEAAGTVPSEEELAKARAHRDHGWTLVQQAYVERSGDPAKLAKGYGSGRALPKEYETAVGEADDLADGLRNDTQRMADHANAAERIAQMYDAIREAEAALGQIHVRQNLWDEEWDRIAGALGVKVQTVRELEEWLAARERIASQLSEVEARDSEAKDLRRDLATARGGLERLLPKGAPDAFAPLLAAADRALETIRDAISVRRERENAVEKLKRECHRLQQRIDAVTSDIADWQKRWSAAVKSLGLSEAADPAEVSARFAMLSELFEAIDEATRTRRDLDEKNALVERYASEAMEIATSVGMATDGRKLGELVAEMFSKCQKAVQASQQRAELSQTLNAEREKLVEAEQEARLRTAEIQRLCQEAGVDDEAGLPAAEASAARKREVKADVLRIEQQLVEQNATPLDRILEEAAPVDRDALAAQIAALDADVADLDQKRDQLAKTLREAELKRDAVDGSSKAADAAQQAQELLAKVKSAAADYVRLKASSIAIARAVDAYREKHQGPMLRRAGEYFSMLTRGSFARLDVDFEGDDQVLVGRRGDELVRVAGMSEGTADQLYLALRLAAIERHLENGPAVPVIVDDILVQFDDDRAGAAIEALANLGAKTQVLLFTHHKHLLELARRVVPPESILVHELT
jgi:DNA repair protein SbcC/Rad50